MRSRKPYLHDQCILNDVNEINTDVHTDPLIFSLSIHWVSFFLVTLISSVSELTWTCFIVLPQFSLHLVCARFFRNSTLLRMDFLLFFFFLTIHIFRGQSFILLSNKRMHCKQQYGTVYRRIQRKPKKFEKIVFVGNFEDVGCYTDGDAKKNVWIMCLA